MICWAFAAVTLAAVLVATFVGDARRSILSLWVAGLGIGGLYLTVGAELLAIVQWVVSTIVAISFIFFAVMFGEYGGAKSGGRGIRSPEARRQLVATALALALGAAFTIAVGYGAGSLPDALLAPTADSGDLRSVGKLMTGEHLLSLEVLAMTLFLVLIGGGVIARPDGRAVEGSAEAREGER